MLLRLAYYIQAKSTLGEIYAFIKSHPEPKGVSVLVDACRRWGIDYELGVISVHELHLVPRYSLLLFPRFEDYLILHEVKDGIARVFHQQKGEINVQVESLQGHWSGSVLLIDAESEHHLPKGSGSILSKPMNWLAVIVLLLTGLQLFHWGQVGMMLLPVLGGMFFSVAAYLTGMGIGSKIAEQVCQSGDQKGACSALLQSPSARVLGVPWSLLGVLYFGIHSMLMLSAVHSPAQESILTIDALLWFSVLPVLGYSLYFQYFRLRAWCRLCLLIGLMLLTGMALTSLLIPIAIGEVHAALPYLLWSLLIVLMVVALMAGHTQACKWVALKQDQRGYHGFLYNPAAVQARLSQSPQLDYFPGLLALAGNESQPRLQIVLSLHCSHCKRLFDDLMQKTPGQDRPGMQLVLLPFGLEGQHARVFQAIVTAEDWAGCLSYWYSIMHLHKAENKFLKHYPINRSTKDSESIIEAFKHFATHHKINSSPRVYLNKIQLPSGELSSVLPWYREAVIGLVSENVAEEL